MTPQKEDKNGPPAYLRPVWVFMRGFGTGNPGEPGSVLVWQKNEQIDEEIAARYQLDLADMELHGTIERFN